MKRLFLYMRLFAKLPRTYAAAITGNDTALDNVVAETEDIHYALGHRTTDGRRP